MRDENIKAPRYSFTRQKDSAHRVSDLEKVLGDPMVGHKHDFLEIHKMKKELEQLRSEVDVSESHYKELKQADSRFSPTTASQLNKMQESREWKGRFERGVLGGDSVSQVRSRISGAKVLPFRRKF